MVVGSAANTMERIIYVKSKDEAAKNQRHGAAQRVVDEFGDKLLEARLLCFFDDEDWWKFKHGKATRGRYSPVDDDLWERVPEYVREQLVMAGPGGLSVNAFDHFIYLPRPEILAFNPSRTCPARKFLPSILRALA